MTIRNLFRIWFFLLAAVTLGELGVSFWVSRTMERRLEAMVESSLVEFSAAQELLKTFAETEALALRTTVAAGAADTAGSDSRQAALHALAQRFERALDQAEQASRRGAELAEDVGETYHEENEAAAVAGMREAFREFVGQLNDLAAFGPRDPAGSVDASLNELFNLFALRIEPRLWEYMNTSLDEQRQKAEAITSQSVLMRRVFVASAMVSVLLVLLGLARITRAVAGPLTRFVEAARRIASGERRLRLRYGRHDEFGELAGSIDGMLDSLRDSGVSQQELEKAVQERTAELQASRESLQVTLDSMGEGVLVTDAQSRVVRLNRVAEAMTGWQTAEACGRPVSEVYHCVAQTGRALLPPPAPSPATTGGSDDAAPRKSVLLCRDGREWPVAEHASAIHDAAGLMTGAVLIFRDETLERAAEKTIVEANANLERQVAERTGALQESERRHRTLLANLPGMAYRWVLKDDRWGVGFLSDGSRAILGLEPAQLLDGVLPFERLLHPGDKEYVRKRFEICLEAQKPFVVEYRIQHSDGSWRWCLDQGRGIWGPDGELAAFEGYISDISERKLTDTALRRLSTELAECSGEAFFQRLAADLADLLGAEVGFVAKVLSETPPRLRAVGLSVDGHTLPPRDFDPTGGPSENVTERRTRIFAKDVAKLFPGNHQLAEWGVSGYAVMPLADALGRVVGRVGVMSRRALRNPEQFEALLQLFSVRAVTEFERMNADENRLKLEGQLRQSQKMESLGTLAGGIAHDFNNILGGMIGFAELLKSENLTPEGIDNLQRVEGAARRGRDLVKQILTFSRRSELERKPVSLGDVTAEAAKLLRSTIPAMVELRTRVAACAPVLADVTQLHQVVVNLVTNAWQALPEAGGCIDIEVHGCEVTTEFVRLHPELRPGPHALLRVMDNGGGMSAEVIARIFDPFFTTKAAGKGTGLGLAVVHGIVELHGGAIRVESVKGRGSVFEIYLPSLAQEAIPAIAPTVVSQPSAAPVRGAHILLVDDEAIIAMSSERLLKRSGYVVTALSSPEEAVARLKDKPGQFDLLLTDLSMPGMTGLELIAAARAIRPELTVILMTGYLDPQLNERIAAMKIDEVLKKPVIGRRLLSSVAAALALRTPAP